MNNLLSLCIHRYFMYRIGNGSDYVQPPHFAKPNIIHMLRGGSDLGG